MDYGILTLITNVFKEIFMKLNRFFSLIITTALLLGGCSEADSSSSPDNSSTADESLSSIADSSSVADSSSSSDSSESDIPFNPDAADFSSFATLADEDMWVLEGENFDYTEDISSFVDNKIAIVTNDYERTEESGHIYLIDLEEGKMKSCNFKPHSDESTYSVYYTGDLIILSDNCLGTFDIYNADTLSKISDIKLPDDAYFTQNELFGNNLFAFSEESGTVYYYTLSDDGSYSENKCNTEFEGMLTLSGAISDSELVFCTESYDPDYEASQTNSVVFDISTGEFSPFSDSAIISSTVSNIVEADTSTNNFKVYGENADIISEGRFPATSSVITANDANDIYFNNLVDSDSVNILRYDADNGKLVSSIAFEGTAETHYIDSIADTDDFAAVVVVDYSEDGGIAVYLFRTSTPASVDENEFIYAENASEKTQKAIDEIKQEFGIDVFVKSPLSDEVYSDYLCTPDENDLNNLYSVLNLQSFLKLFPDGFFQELVEIGGIEGIDIYFFESIESGGSTDGTIPTAGGLCFYFYDPLVIAFRTNTGMTVDNNLAYAHEFMHAIDALTDNTMFEDENGNHLTPFDNLDALNPSGFDYSDSYAGYDLTENSEAKKYFPDYTESYEDVAFFDLYSANFELEDLAMTFGHIFNVGEGEMPDYYYESEYLQRKSAYVCHSLRYTFDCIDEGDVLPWEHNVDLEKYSFEAILDYAQKNDTSLSLAG